MNVYFEIGALFHAAIRWGKRGANFKTNIHLDSVESFLYCLCFSRHPALQPQARYHAIMCVMLAWISGTANCQCLLPLEAKFSVSYHKRSWVYCKIKKILGNPCIICSNRTSAIKVFLKNLYNLSQCLTQNWTYFVEDSVCYVFSHQATYSWLLHAVFNQLKAADRQLML